MEPLDHNDDMISDLEIDGASPPENPSPWEGIGTRLISSIVLAALFLVMLWRGGFVFTWLMLLVALLMAREWNALTENEQLIWRIGGIFYVTIPTASAIWLRDVHFEGDPSAGRWLVLFVAFAVWATDIGAYFTGRYFGGAKLAPAISPGKTWAGLGGGIAAAAVTGGVAHSFSPYPQSILACIALGGLLAVLAQAGDLFESWVKRRAGVKDSGTLIPGHGGLLDRIDGLTLTLPMFAWCVWLSGLAL